MFKQWSVLYTNAFPNDSSVTGFCMLPISLTKSYYWQVYGNFANHYYSKDAMSNAANNSRRVNFIVDTYPNNINSLNGFSYRLDFSTNIQNIGLSYYALIVCIKLS